MRPNELWTCLDDGAARGGVPQATARRGCMMLRHGGGRRVWERDRIATGVDAKDVAGVGVEEEAWDGRAADSGAAAGRCHQAVYGWSVLTGSRGASRGPARIICC